MDYGPMEDIYIADECFIPVSCKWSFQLPDPPEPAPCRHRRYFFRPEGGQWREVRWLTFQLVKFDLDRNEAVAVVDAA